MDHLFSQKVRISSLIFQILQQCSNRTYSNVAIELEIHRKEIPIGNTFKYNVTMHETWSIYARSVLQVEIDLSVREGFQSIPASFYSLSYKRCRGLVTQISNLLETVNLLMQSVQPVVQGGTFTVTLFISNPPIFFLSLNPSTFFLSNLSLSLKLSLSLSQTLSLS